MHIQSRPLNVRLAIACLAFSLSACGEAPGAGARAVPNPSSIYEPVTPAVPNATYAKVLGDCAFNADRRTSCSLTTLPFLGQDNTTLTVDKIMERVAVSHPWMAVRFREVLLTQPTELLQMMRPITAVIIGSKVRPSYYFSMTGAIYLDPEGLWLTQAERNTIDTTPDFRTDFGKDLQFRAIWRYVKNNDYAYPFYSQDFKGTRTVADIRIALGRLLAHELAHAGDFSPPANLATLSRNQTAEEAINAQASQWISEKLRRSKPLTSTAWPSLAQVLYANQTPTAGEKSYSPAQAGNLVEPDRAADAYGYFSQFEDVAMMTEEILSWCFYGIQRDFATSNRPSSGDFTVGWGVRGRIATPQVTDASRFVTRELLPGVSLDSCYASLPAPVKLRAGASWTSNLNPSGTSATAKSVDEVMLRPTDALPPG